MVSSVEPEVAAVPMTMAAVTPRSNGQSTNGFAKVEQGKSYVLSVNAPSGSGEVELLAADSDTQSEPDMFSLLYTKVENSMQIPFVAVSSWVYVQAGNSSINWLVTPANFSLAVPGVSSGGGESFDPTADQTITGEWTFDRQVDFNSAVNISDAGYINLAGQISLQSTGGIEGPKIPDASIYDNLYLPTVNNDERYMRKTGNETVAGVKTFSSSPVVPTPTTAQQASNKSYVDSNFVTTSTSQTITGGKTFADGGTLEVPIPTSQGMAANKQYVDTSVVTGITQLAIKFSSLTKAEYDALETKSNSTIYFLTDKSMWAIGGKEIGHSNVLTTLELVAESASETNVLKIPASAPSGIYELEFPGGIASYAFNVIAFENYDSLASSNQSLLGLANPPLIVTNGTATVLEWMWDDVESASMVSIPNGSTIASLKCLFSHTQGTETNLLKLTGLNIFTSGISVKKVVVRQIA